MRRLLRILACLTLLPFLTGATVVINPYGFAVAGSSYLLDVDFESGGGGFTGNVTGDFDLAATSPTMQGTKCASSFSFTDSYAFATFTAGGSRYAYFQYRLNAMPGGLGKIAALRDSGGTELLTLSVQSNGVLVMNSYDTTCAGPLVINTIYHVWIEYVKGTGSNASYKITLSTDGTKPTSGAFYMTFTSGTGTADAAQFLFHNENGEGGPASFDHILVSSTAIGSSP